MNEKLQLALDEFIHVGVVLVVIIALVSVLTGLIRAFIPQEKLQKKLSKTGRFGSLMGALLGVPTPFCSASMVPVSMGMVEMGAPFSMVFAFLVSAPLANFVVVGFIFGVFGWKVALTYFLIVFLGAIIAGSFWGKTKIKNEVKRIALNKQATTSCGEKIAYVSYCTPTPDISGEAPKTSCYNERATTSCSGGAVAIPNCESEIIVTAKIRSGLNFAWSLFKRIMPYVLLGVIISAISSVFVPDAWVEKYLGNDSIAAIPLASAVGIPLYLRIEMAIPLLQVLIAKGMSMGAAMALIIGGIGASLPELAIISSMLKPKAIAAFIATIMTLGVVGGFIFHFLF